MSTDMLHLSYALPSPFLIHDLSPDLKEELEDTKGAIRIRISKKNRYVNLVAWVHPWVLVGFVLLDL
jgi:hypothetical protein